MIISMGKRDQSVKTGQLNLRIKETESSGVIQRTWKMTMAPFVTHGRIKCKPSNKNQWIGPVKRDLALVPGNLDIARLCKVGQCHGNQSLYCFRHSAGTTYHSLP